jgi:hypothetical protein
MALLAGVNAWFLLIPWRQSTTTTTTTPTPIRNTNNNDVEHVSMTTSKINAPLKRLIEELKDELKCNLKRMNCRSSLINKYWCTHFFFVSSYDQQCLAAHNSYMQNHKLCNIFYLYRIRLTYKCTLITPIWRTCFKYVRSICFCLSHIYFPAEAIF